MKKSLLLFYCSLFFIIAHINIFSQAYTWTVTKPTGNSTEIWTSASMSSDGTKLIAGAYHGRLYTSTDGGNSWAENQPAGDINKVWWTSSISSDGSNIIAGINGGRLYIHSESITSAKENQLLTKEYNLSQNYPNPFNPITTINYQLPKEGNVTLKFYDILGREVKTLVNGFKLAGFYEVQFNASYFASGIYLYRLQIGSYSDTKKSCY